MKPKSYSTTTKQNDDRTVKIADINSLRPPNPELLYARMRNRAVTFEDRRYKKPKHKSKLFED